MHPDASVYLSPFDWDIPSRDWDTPFRDWDTPFRDWDTPFRDWDTPFEKYEYGAQKSRRSTLTGPHQPRKNLSKREIHAIKGLILA